MTVQDSIAPSAREMSYAEAIRDAMAIALDRDQRVILMGEDIGVYGGAFQVTGDLIDRFGPDRVMDTPISELGGAGVAVGAALTGLRPIFEFQFSDFATLAMEQIVNQAAKLRYMLGGEASVPLVMRMPSGSGTGAAAQHSQSLEAWFGHVPGLKVVQPATPADAKGLLLAALEDPDPVIVFEHKLLYKMKGEVPEGTTPCRSARPRSAARARDLTIVASAIMVHRALDAAEDARGRGHLGRGHRPALDPPDRPRDDRRQRLQDRPAALRLRGRRARSASAPRSARMVAESEAFDYLDAPILRLGGRRGADPLQPGPGEGRRAAGAGHRGRRPPPGAPGGLTCPSKSSCPRSTWTWRPGSCRPGTSPKASWSTKGAPLFDIETDKAAMEVESPATGRLAQHRGRARADRRRRRAGRLDLCRGRGRRSRADPRAPPRRAGRAGGAAAGRRPAPAPGRRRRATGTARPRRWRGGWRATRGLALASVAGTGPRGRIQRDDVEEALRARRAGRSRRARRGPSRCPAPVPARAALPAWAAKRAISSSRPARAAARRS